MIPVNDALEMIMATAKDFGTETVPLLYSTGRILRQAVKADRDFPAYDRVTMDGIAINSNSLNSGRKTFFIQGMQAAGQPPLTMKEPVNCIEVMTGAVLPGNTNAVIPYEQFTITNGYAAINTAEVAPFQNIHLNGKDAKAGDILINENEIITASAIGTMATVGMCNVLVGKFPKIAVYSTGDELLDISLQPEPYQIRQSNNYMTASTLVSMGLDVTIDHLPDNVTTIKSRLADLMEYDVLLLSGAVSKGKFDLMPAVLQEMGMKLIFHNVAQRPGKPMLFGTFDNGPVVFGFPGNPVSTSVCFHHYFMPWLRKCIKMLKPPIYTLLGEDINFTPPLTLHQLVTITNDSGKLIAYPINNSTSGDMVKLTKAHGYVTLPAGESFFAKGSVVKLNLFE